jgi:hypothetical protein
MKLVLAAIAAAAVTLSGCTNPQTAANVEADVLNAGQIACVLLNAVTDAKAVATACNIADNLIPVVESTLAAHRQGVGIPAKAGCAGH